MDLTNYKILLFIIVFSVTVSLSFGIALLFFYERFRIFNNLVNYQILVGGEKYKEGGYLIDKWVMDRRIFFGILALFVAAWLFLMFCNYFFL